MNDPPTHPAGLTSGQLERLEELVRHSHGFSPKNLLQLAYSHLDDVQGIRAKKPEVDSKLAEAIFHVIDRVASEWQSFSPVEQSWLRASIEYFLKPDDAQPDLAEDGFRDDVQVLNACLRFAGREEWILNPDDIGRAD
jgi:uncharacterized membrane protein YkvA (DUF1232 family)